MTIPSSTDFPWHQPVWEALTDQLAANRLPHALLLSGPVGVGKSLLAARFAQLLLCEQPRSGPCDSCKACRMAQIGAHADLWRVAPEEDSRAIKIEQIRELCRAITLKAQHGGFKVAIIEPAEVMTINAANSLLKSLEEPTAGTVLLLISAEPSRLPVTVRSRCQSLYLNPPNRDDGRAWIEARCDGSTAPTALEMASGAPLRALRLIEEGAIAERTECFKQWLAVVTGRADPIAVASIWNEKRLILYVEWQISWVADLIRLAQPLANHALSNSDLAKPLQGVAQQLGLRLLYSRFDQLLDTLKYRNSNLNQQLVLEELLISWAGCINRG